MKLAEKYLSNCDALMVIADRSVKYVIGNNRLSTLVVLKRYDEAIALAMSLIQKLEIEVRKN